MVPSNLTTCQHVINPIHCKLFPYHRGDCNNSRDLIRDSPLDLTEDMLLDSDRHRRISFVSSKASLYLWFSPSIDAAISHRNHFIIVINVVVTRTTGLFLLEAVKLGT